MMELTCAFVLIFASLVSATPYGYGVKGGASARAESSASAGAFGGVGEVPVAVPLGAGYSGSFSKSSASSFASSSASSSSSSSSFSYSGAGAPGALGFGANNGAQGNAGCSSGHCQNAGPHGLHGSAANAAAVASADASAISGSGCQGQGKDCDLNPKKCAAGQCSPKTQTGIPSTNSDNKKCAEGNCGSDADSSASPENDIRVIPDVSGSTYNSKDKTYNSDGSDCNQGNCGPNDYGKQHLPTSKPGVPSSYHTPATHLETPKLNANCNSPNCETKPEEAGHKTPPSSYNVPIHGTYNNEGGQKPACDGVQCENEPKGTYTSSKSNSVSTNYLKPQLSTDNYVTNVPSSFDKQSPTSCGGSNCAGVPSQNFGPSPSPKPGNVNYGNYPADMSLNSNGCKTPNCSPYPTNTGASNGFNVSPGHVGVGPSDNVKPASSELPVYTGGFGGPAGLFKPNENNVGAVPSGHPSHSHPSSSQHVPSYGSTSIGCNAPNCADHSLSSPGNTAQPSFGVNQPEQGNRPNEKLPTYTGGFAGPSGMLKPNEFNTQTAVPINPNYAHPTSSSYNKHPSSPNYGANQPTEASHPNEKLPTYTGGFGGPSGMLKPNEFNTQTAVPINPNYAHPMSSSYNKQPSSPNYGANQPTEASHPNEKLPSYTGGFGGPAGMLKPNEFNIHSPVPNNPNYAHPTSSSYNKQPSSSNYGAAGCKTPNCGGYFPTSGASFQPSTAPGLFVTTKPSTGNTLPNEKLPAYNSGFGAPSGVLKPSQYFTPTTGPDSHSYGPSGSYNRPSTNGNLAGCDTPNCYPSAAGAFTPTGNSQPDVFGVSKPNSALHPTGIPLPYPSRPSGEIIPPAVSPSYTNAQSPSAPGSYSTGCKTANCATYPSSSASADANAQAGAYSKPNADSSSGKLPQYTGSFGGPSGTLKPHENVYNTPTSSLPNTSCKTPNCVSSPSATSGTHSGSDITTKPSQLPAYTGGFGGASGLLKPNDNTVSTGHPLPHDSHKPLAPNDGVKPSVSCTSGTCNTPVTQGSAAHNTANGVHAIAAASSDAKSVPYTGGFGGPPGVLKPYDNGDIKPPHSNNGQHHGSPTGGSYNSPSANVNSPHKTHPDGSSGPSGPAGIAGHDGAHPTAQAGGAAGSYAGAAAGASAGALYNTPGSHYNGAGNAKGGSPCGGGCGGDGQLDGLNGGKSLAGAAAAAKSLATAGAYGGSFASSSASTHASAGAYTKGGYGKR